MFMMAHAISPFATWLNTTFASFDLSVWEFFGHLHSQAMTTFVSLYTNLGDTVFVIPVLIACLVMCFFKKTRKYGMTVFFAIVIGTLITNVIVKPLVARPRPYVSLADNPTFVKLWSEVGKPTESEFSFPSGHTTAAFEIGLALFLVTKHKSIKWIYPVYAVTIAISRLYLCVHYCTDVFGGIIIGVVSAVLAYFVAKSIMNLLDTQEKKKKVKSQKLSELEVVADTTTETEEKTDT